MSLWRRPTPTALQRAPERNCSRKERPDRHGDKKRFHKKSLHESIYELTRVVHPALTVADGFYCIEAGNCSAGTAKKKGYPLVKSCNPDYREIVNISFPGYYRIAQHATRTA